MLCSFHSSARTLFSQRTFSALPVGRAFMSSSTSSKPANDWSSAQYLKFENERTQPARDLLARVPLQHPKRIVDLGCGPGNSTAVLETRYPKSELVGMDSSPDMIQKAKSTLPHIDFTVENLDSYSPKAPVDLFYSNAVFQWLGREQRINVIKRLMDTQPSGGVFALQVPDNLDQPSHVMMRETAKSGPWAEKLRSIGRDSFQSPTEMYDALKPISSQVDIFRTSYFHSLESHEAIIEWVKGTGLRPFLDPLEQQEKEEFLKEYLARLKDAYPSCVDGRVLLPYPRLFVVAVKQ